MRPSANCSAVRRDSADASGTRYSTAVIWLMNWTGPVSSSATLRLRLEALDVGDLAFALGGPADLHARAGRRGLGRAGVADVQHRRVGAVEPHEHPRERPVERMVPQRLGHPRRVLDDAAGADLHHPGGRFAGIRVVLERRYEHPPVGGTGTEHLLVA